MDTYDYENAIQGTRKFFSYGTLATKIILIIGFIILSYMHADAAFISQNPRIFLTESLLTGLSGLIPFAILAYNRNIPFNSIISKSSTVFLLFFCLM